MSHDHAGHAHPHAHPHPHLPAVGGDRRPRDIIEGRAGERRRLALAIALTAAIFVVEVIGGLRSHFLALLADAGHMLSDVAAQALSLGALYLAARKTDPRRTWGWYRVEILAALVNGLALLGLGAGIVWSAVGRLSAGPAPIHAEVAMGVAALGLCANLGGAWLLHGSTSLNVRGAYLHVLQDTLSSVLVLLGGAALALRPAWWILDPLLSMSIAGFVIVSALRLLREAAVVLLEAAPDHLDVGRIAAALTAEEAVREVHDLHLWTITSGVHALSVHVVADGDCRADHHFHDDLLCRMKRMLGDRFAIHHATIQIESPNFRVTEGRCAGCED